MLKLLILTGALHGAQLDVEGLFSMLDKDKNGSLSKDETNHDSKLNKDFSRWDSNRDGRISLGEFKHYLNTRKKS